MLTASDPSPFSSLSFQGSRSESPEWIALQGRWRNGFVLRVARALYPRSRCRRDGNTLYFADLSAMIPSL